MPTPPAPPANQPPSAPDPATKYAGTPSFTAVLTETNPHLDQLQRRQKLLKEIDKAFSTKYRAVNRTMVYLFRFGHARAMMTSSDIAPFEDTLKSLTGADQINLILQSPGGDGTIVEKMIDMCRAHLSGTKPKFRVIVPNIAKSAATVMALGADTIMMGYSSELGPIDPQVPISVSGLVQWVSAFAFVDSRDTLMNQISDAVANNRPLQGLLQQLAGLNIPFTNEMENHIAFAKMTAGTLLNKFMLKSKYPNASQRKIKADEIAEKLLSKQLFPVHGQTISGATAKGLGLEVELLERTDKLWELIWEYYIRCELQMNLQVQPGMLKTKFFESAFMSLAVQDTPN